MLTIVRLGQQLRKRGYTVHIANHGEEALTHIASTRLWTENNGTGSDLTVVLMDVEMPVMDVCQKHVSIVFLIMTLTSRQGMTCARRIRKLQADGFVNTHIPIIAVTANARSKQVEDAISAGMVSSPKSKPASQPVLIFVRRTT